MYAATNRKIVAVQGENSLKVALLNDLTIIPDI